jgi:flagellum-specific peptidoglycan hydrolase FlgJ
VRDEKISSVKVEMTNDNNSVEFNAEVKDDAEMVIDAPVRSYEDLLTSLQDDTKMLVYNARSEQIRQLCRSLTTECAEGQKQALNKSVEAAGDDYFLRLFGLMSE